MFSGEKMASVIQGKVSAVQVGSYFLGQYYHFLQQTPNLVHQFYGDSSSMIRYNGENNESASGIAEIHNLIIRLNFTEIEIKTAHSLESWDGGVLVTVTGFVQAKDFICRRNFVETFFLAPQEKGYFILNDIFLLLEDEQFQQHPVHLMHDEYDRELSTLDPVQDPVSSYILGEDIPLREFSSPPIPVEINNEVENYSVPVQQQEAPGFEEREDEPPAEQSSASVSSVSSTIHDQPVPAEELVEEPPKHTYASILCLRTTKAQGGQHLTPMNKATPMLAEWQHAPLSTQHGPPISSVPEKSGSESWDEYSSLEDEGDSKSVYVGNLPASISTSDLDQEFRNFGRIKPNGVTIRSRKEAGVFYAFIEFEEASAVQNALKASPVQLNGRLIHVEGRRPNSGASRGRRSRGRVGYNSETQKSRFGGRSSGRGNAQDHDRDYNRQRGNGYLQRAPRQERVTLGNQP
ncbi:hypothetical protein HPP92_005115 [Vanilla planifolia]|uniref:G3BP-like protein n=1 Tax=Vanilla planifolia TaxID=51239 RepID=A0A835RTS5_VANPL|nr:hypothetical protein HPP92_005115 [Vanilla planifolia]